MAKIFFFFPFLYPPHQVKQIHKSYCTEVLQSANIMNWHKLVYTSHFLDDRNNQKSMFFFVQSGTSSHTPFALDSPPPTSSLLHSRSQFITSFTKKKKKKKKKKGVFSTRRPPFPMRAALHRQKLLAP